MIAKSKSKGKPKTAVGMFGQGPGRGVVGVPGKEWSEVGDSYAAGLVSQFDRLWDMHFDGTIQAPLTEAELELVECVRSGGVETLRARARECLALVGAYEPELRSGEGQEPDGLTPAARHTGSLSGKTRKKAVRAKQAERRPVWGPAEVIPLDRCVMHPANSPHSDEDIAARAVSLERTGQLEAIKVWPLPDEPQERYLVLGGWGRVLAARKAKWTEIEARPLRGIQIDGQMGFPEDQDLLGLLAEDNSQRRTLSVLDKAALGRKLEEAGWSCDEAARRVGFQSASSLSNAKRLLDLPQPLRALVDLPDGDPKKLPQATLRKLADYGHVPQIVRAVLEDLEDNAEDWRLHPEDSLNYVLREATRPVDRTSQDLLGFHLAPPPAAADLPAITVQVTNADGEKEDVLVTTATKEWDTLRSQWDKQAQRAEPAERTTPAKRELSPDEKRHNAKQKAEQLAGRRRRWEYRWRHAFVVRQIETSGAGYFDALRELTIWAVCENQNAARDHLKHEIESRKLAKGLARKTFVTLEELLSYVPVSQRHEVLERMLVRILREPFTSNPEFPHVPHWLVWEMCTLLQWHPSAEWDVLYDTTDGKDLLRDLWNTHETDQLVSVANKAGVKIGAEKKRDLVEALLQTKIACPDCLLVEPQGKKGKRA